MMGNRKQHRTRRGYTLMEMLLVQGVIVSLVAMSWPALRHSLDKNRLVAAARQVRTDLVQARLQAAETGIARQFRFQNGEAEYEVGSALAVENRSSGIKPMRVAAADSRRSGADGDSDGAGRRSVTLDDGLCFAMPEPAKDDDRVAAAKEKPKAKRQADLDDESTEEASSQSIVFYPNGRANNARVRLAGASGFHVDVTVRGLTGSVTIGDIERDEVVE